MAPRMTPPYRIRPGDVDHLIADDHAVLARLRQHLEAGRGRRDVLADQIDYRLAVRKAAVSQVLPALDASGDDELAELGRLRERVGDDTMAALGRDFRAAQRAAHTNLESTARSRLATDASGLLDPQAQAVLDAFASLDPLPIELLEPEQARSQPTVADAVAKVLHEQGNRLAPQKVETEDRSISGPAGEIPIRVYRPEGAPPTDLPVVVYVHGGGWVIGGLDGYDATPHALANKAGCVVVGVEFRHAPEHPFPAAHEDVTAATRWTLMHAHELGGDPDRVAILGESAGGNMAAATCRQLQEVGSPMPVAQALICPITTGAQEFESFHDAADACPLNRPLLSWFLHHTLSGSAESLSDHRLELLGVPVDDLAGLPPAVVITAERDPLRSQGEEFAHRLEQAGVPVTARRFDGVPHEFFGMAAVLDQADEAQLLVADHLDGAFGAASAGTAGPGV